MSQRSLTRDQPAQFPPIDRQVQAESPTVMIDRLDLPGVRRKNRHPYKNVNFMTKSASRGNNPVFLPQKAGRLPGLAQMKNLLLYWFYG